MSLSNYLMSRRPPRIDFVTGARLNCQNGRGFLADAVDSATGQVVRACSFGRYLPGPDVIEMAWVPGQTFAGSALCHELGHAALWRVTGDPDARHTGVVFALGGLSDECEAFLRERGW